MKTIVLVLFGVILLKGYIKIFDFYAPKRYGPSTRSQIETSFKNAKKLSYQLLILGNSRVYRGINSDLTTIPSYNFGHDNDTFNQMYFKLLHVTKEKKIDYLIVGIDYFSFSYLEDSRNYIYRDLLDKAYLEDYYIASLPNWLNFVIQSFKSVYMGFIKYAGIKKSQMLLRSIIYGAPTKIPFLKENGQYIKPGIAKPTDYVKRDYKLLELQLSYLNKIVEYSIEKKIQIVFVMLPLREVELAQYENKSLAKFYDMIQGFESKGVQYFDFSKNQSFIMSDFSDFSHLNEIAANKFTKLLDSSLIKNGFYNVDESNIVESIR